MSRERKKINLWRDQHATWWADNQPRPGTHLGPPSAVCSAERLARGMVVDHTRHGRSWLRMAYRAIGPCFSGQPWQTVDAATCPP
jgi:hypothetical protein